MTLLKSLARLIFPDFRKSAPSASSHRFPWTEEGLSRLKIHMKDPNIAEPLTWDDFLEIKEEISSRTEASEADRAGF